MERQFNLRSCGRLVAASIIFFALYSPPYTGAQVRIPSVGCPSDGQAGPREAPPGASKVLPIVARDARNLAYYEAAANIGVLAPRGWYCLDVYGSGGDSLLVSLQPIHSEALFSKDWRVFDGPAIQISRADCGLSGRFEAARIVAKVFPDDKNFVKKMIKEWNLRGEDFPFGPYPTDSLHYKSKHVVEYETPGLTDGLGTDSRLLKNNSPIRGVVIFAESQECLVHLSVRLPVELAYLTPSIIQEVERQTAPKK